ncbi:MAG TPA: Ig-like domain-containing protein [Candidatus Krumholzibacteria bacterium]|nr:Ig-like domain-containing protein [Candidatus Krumholzibacteria bacterium]
MNRRILGILLAMLLAVLALVAACSSDNPTEVPDDQDTTPPVVVTTYPAAGAVAVAITDSIIIAFNEAMDPTTSSGNITLSAGSILGSTWYTDRVLALAHNDWPSGGHITVTVGPGLRDAAGNTMAAAHAFSFWTATSELLVLSTDPADGATGVNRDASIGLVFTRDVDGGSLASHVTIADVITKAIYPYTYNHTDEGHYLLRPDASLPASTQLAITVEAGLQSADGLATLAQPFSIAFTTGTDLDTTPPMVIATFPADGLTGVGRDIGYLQMTFSEPVDQDTLEPAAWNLEFYLAFMQAGIPPSWSADFTVLTIPLPSQLPPGLPVEVRFVDFADLAGNVQTVAFTWNFTVEGTPDYVPVVDGQRYYDDIAWSEGVGGTTNNSGYGTDYVRLEVQSGSSFRMVRYDDSGFTTPSGDWESYNRTSTALLWTGFESVSKGVGLLHEKENVFSTPLNILPLPPSARTWTSSTSVTVPGEGDYTATLDGRIIGQVDLPIPETGGTIYAKNAWKVARTLTVALDGSPAFTQVDTTWYAANLGEVHEVHRETETGSGAWFASDTWRFPVPE